MPNHIPRFTVLLVGATLAVAQNVKNNQMIANWATANRATARVAPTVIVMSLSAIIFE